MNKIYKYLTLIGLGCFLYACSAIQLTSIFVRNYTDSPVSLKLTGVSQSLFEDGKAATYVSQILKKRKLKIGACASGDTLKIVKLEKSNQITLPANSTTEIIFPLYKILQVASNLSIETTANGITKNYFSNQFDEIVKNRKDIYYIDLK